jgi:hypothetical protein
VTGEGSVLIGNLRSLGCHTWPASMDVARLWHRGGLGWGHKLETSPDLQALWHEIVRFWGHTSPTSIEVTEMWPSAEADAVHFTYRTVVQGGAPAATLTCRAR